MSIVTLKRNSQAKHCRNHSNGNQGFSVWATTNSGQYNGSRLISGFSSTHTPFKGSTPVGTSYVDRYGRGGYKYNKNVIHNCGYEGSCTNVPGAVKNTSGMLTNKLMGTRHGKLNTVKQYKNNNMQSEYTKSLHNQTNACYYKNLRPDQFEGDTTSCQATSITIGNGRKILVGNYVKTGNLAKNAIGYEDYNSGKLINNNGLNNICNELIDQWPNPLVTIKNGVNENNHASSYMKSSSSFRNVCSNSGGGVGGGGQQSSDAGGGE